VIGISVGKRNEQMLRKTINAVLMTSPEKIYTDGLHTYKRLIPKCLHRISKVMLCHVERLHLTVRNSLKMLNRKTLSFVRKSDTLMACLKLLFWNLANRTIPPTPRQKTSSCYCLHPFYPQGFCPDFWPSPLHNALFSF